MRLEERRVMRRPEVERVTGISRSILCEMIKSGEFPKPMRLGRRAVGWPETVVSDWLDPRPNGGASELVVKRPDTHH